MHGNAHPFRSRTEASFICYNVPILAITNKYKLLAINIYRLLAISIIILLLLLLF